MISFRIDIHRDKGNSRGRQPEDTLTSIKGEPVAFSNAVRELLLVMNSEYENKEKEKEEEEEEEEESVDKNDNADNEGSDSGDQENKKEQQEEKQTLQLKLLAHDLLCGRIIGKGGNNLKLVRQESGVTKLIISNSM